MSERKIVQITVTTSQENDDCLYALCDDGTVWRLDVVAPMSWELLPRIPVDVPPWDVMP